MKTDDLLRYLHELIAALYFIKN